MKSNTQHASAIVGKAIAGQTRSTPPAKINTREWAKWLAYETFDDPQLMAMVNGVARFVIEVDSKRVGPRCEGTSSGPVIHPPKYEKIETPMPWLVLLGTSGAGKSHLQKAVYKWWVQAGQFFQHQGRGFIGSKRGQYVKWSNLIKEFKGQDFSRMTDMVSDHFLILDDIGAGAESKGWVIDSLYHLLENRLEQDKATFITANLSVQQISDAYDPRIASRLIRPGIHNVIEVNVPDYAMRAKQLPG